MRTVSRRKRTAEDDVKAVHRVPNAVVTDDSVTIPEPPESPIVVWGKASAGSGDDACLTWPTSCDKRCHNCSHHFSGVPVPLPVSRDELRQVYYCEGKFCSWQCVKSFNIRETSPAGKGNRNMYIAILAYKTWIKLREQPVDRATRDKMKAYCDYKLDPAPPRSALVEFGGHLSIDEYRKGFCGIVPPSDIIEGTSPYLRIRQMAILPFIDTDSVDSCPPVSDDKPKPGRAVSGTRRIETNRVQEFSNSFVDRLKKAKQDPAIMVRKKAMDPSNTLLSSMGIEIKKRKR